MKGKERDTPVVLVVDDDATTRLLISEVLDSEGYIVEQAENGKDGLEAFQRRRPDVVLLDVSMPGMSGFECCERMRLLPDGAHVPIVVITGYDDDKAISRAFEVGATDFIAKPMRWKLLARRLRYILRASDAIENLARSEARLQTMVTRLSLATEAGNVGVWDWNLVDNSLIWDDNVYRIYQIPRDQGADLYAAWAERVHPDDLPRLEVELKVCIEERRELRSAFRTILPSGDVRHFNTHAIIQTDVGGQATRMIGIDYDVTELVKQRLKAEESEARAITANRAKTEFLAVVSHELRTPLNAIIGFSDLMVGERLGPIQNEQYKNFSKDIRDSGGLLLSLINDILDMTRIESGKFDLCIEPVDPHELSQEIAKSLVPSADEKGIRLTVASAIEVPAILGDRRALRQLLTNLVANGIKFTSSGGEVRLTAELGSSPDQVVLVVSDNGRGIPRERIADLCRPFVQVAESWRRDVGGLGLGLAISRSLAEAMDGRLEIDSDLGCGTVVRVALPAACAA